MVIRQFNKDQVIFREKEQGNSFYQMKSGSVGIFLNYGEEDEKKLTELTEGQFFGEMAVIEAYPRSATAVALSDDTKAEEITLREVEDYFRSEPDQIIAIMKHLGSRVRELTDDYTKVSETIKELYLVKKEERSKSLIERIRNYADNYRAHKNFTEIPSVETLRKIDPVSHSEGYYKDVESFSKGTVIFKEGETGNCMYDIHSGNVGIYKNYGTPEEELLTKLSMNNFFGEMGMVDNDKRSATAIVLTDDTNLETIAPEDLAELFEKNPPKVSMILAHISYRLRKLTNEYMNACKLVYEYASEEEKNGSVSEELKDKTDNYQARYYD
ncbi:MAG: cyclic nucleotide-binding domain-containing protein [Lachnospiraceae bacterium]|nr:cyclic nucleotide-binding domain-containing protein [Lachnospiraceae bacterium]